MYDPEAGHRGGTPGLGAVLREASHVGRDSGRSHGMREGGVPGLAQFCTICH